MGAAHSRNSIKSEGLTDLLKLINSQQWVLAQQLLEQRGQQEASVWYVEKRSCHGSTVILIQILPLHRVCELNAPEALIKALLTAFRDASKLKDYGNGWLPLHWACVGCSQRDCTAINLILGAYEEGAKVKDKLGRLPVHIACENGASKEVIETLLAAWPDSSKQKDKEGKYPIHVACQYRASEDVINVLLKYNPNSVNVRDYGGMLPLDHMASGSHPNKKVILASLQRQSSSSGLSSDSLAFKIRNMDRTESTEKTSLYKFIEERRWDEAIGYCKANPGEAKVWFVLKNADDRGWWRQLPIHEASKLSPPTAVVEALLNAYVEGAQAADHYGVLPLHLACWGGGSPDLVQLLLQAFPKGVETRDKKGMLPLHSACWGKASEEVIHTLIREFPESITCVDDYDRTPLKIVQERDKPVKEIVKAALSESTKKTELYKCLEKKRWADALKRLQANPSDASIPYIVKDSYGAVLSFRLPLHLAVQLKPDIEVIEALLEAYINAVKSKGNGDSLPIHYAVAHNASAGVIEALLRYNPKSVNQEDGDGYTPLKYALNRTDSERDAVINLLQRDPDEWGSNKVQNTIESAQRTELYRLVAEKQWDAAVGRCKSVPDEAKTWHVLKNSEGRVCWRELPIHHACQLKPTLEVVETLLEAYSDGAREKDNFGVFALHFACEYGAGDDVIITLLKSNPTAVHVEDSFGRTPWKIMLQKDHPDKQRVLAYMRREVSKQRGEIPDDASEYDVSSGFNSGPQINPMDDFLDEEKSYADWKSVLKNTGDDDLSTTWGGGAHHKNRLSNNGSRNTNTLNR